MQCKVHIIDSNRKTYRIRYTTKCKICKEKIIGTDLYWFNWDFKRDEDPDMIFADIRSKYYAFKRVKLYTDLNLDFSSEQKSFIRLIRPKMAYWMSKPIPRGIEYSSEEELYIPEGYEVIGCRDFVDTLWNR